jgi:hypothetical protein
MTILFTFGANDRGEAEVRPDANGQMRIHVTGSMSVLNYVDLGKTRVIPYLLYGGNAPQPPLRLPARPSLIFNQISDPDSHAIALERCVTLCDALKLPVINHPRDVLANSREQVAGQLAGMPGVRVPRTIRCAPRTPQDVLDLASEAGIDQDFIFRTIGEHNGDHMVRVRGKDQFSRLHAFPFDGREFYLVEFVDYREGEALYRKHRICMLEGEPLAKHSSFSTHWKVHINARGGGEFIKAHPEYGTPAENLKELVEQRLPLARESLQEIAKRIKLDFFIVDCHIDSKGHIVVFEANSTANVLPNSKSGTPENDQRIRERVSGMILERLRRSARA